MRRLLLPLVALLLAGTATFAVRAWLERRDSLAVAAAPRAGAAQGGAGGGGRPRRRLLRAAGLDALAGLARRCRARDLSGPRRRATRHSSLAPSSGARSPSASRLSAGSVVKPGERGFLAAVLEPGMRAISVPVDEAAGNAGLIFPGDRVDLILTQTLSAEGDPAGDATGQRDRARGSAGHRHGTPADQRRRAKRNLPASRRARPRSRPRPKPPRKSRSWPSSASSP